MMKMISRLGLLVCFVVLSFSSGCTKSKLNPCGLLDLTEIQAFDDTISTSQSSPPKGEETNDLCLYYNASGEPRLMVFVWSDQHADPFEVTRKGMGDGDSEVVEILGVGDKAAAGFNAGELKLFAASNQNGMIGIRVRDPVTRNDAKLDEVKSLTAKLLAHLE